MRVLVNVGGSTAGGSLDAKGRFKSPDKLDQLKLKQRNKDGTWTLLLKRKKGAFAQGLDDEGLLDEANVKPGKPVRVVVSIDTGNEAYGRPLELPAGSARETYHFAAGARAALHLEGRQTGHGEVAAPGPAMAPGRRRRGLWITKRSRVACSYRSRTAGGCDDRRRVPSGAEVDPRSAGGAVVPRANRAGILGRAASRLRRAAPPDTRSAKR